MVFGIPVGGALLLLSLQDSNGGGTVAGGVILGTGVWSLLTYH